MDLISCKLGDSQNPLSLGMMNV